MIASVAVGVLCVAAPSAEACTTTIVTRGASADGSAYVTHSNDAFESDPNIVYVPAKDHPAGATRKVYPAAIAWDELPEYNCFSNPRLVAPERAEDYDYPGKKRTKPLGEIPEVAHTYAYIDSDYGVMNEHGLMLGECTNNSANLEYLEPKERPRDFLRLGAGARRSRTLPEAYTKADRAEFDLTKAWWISQQVTVLTRGYYSVFSAEVRDAAHAQEKQSMDLLAGCSGQAADDFAQTLRDNAGKVLSDWRDLHGNLLAAHDGDHHIGYDESYVPKADKVTKY